MIGWQGGHYLLPLVLLLRVDPPRYEEIVSLSLIIVLVSVETLLDVTPIVRAVSTKFILLVRSGFAHGGGEGSHCGVTLVGHLRQDLGGQVSSMHSCKTFKSSKDTTLNIKN